MIISKGVFFIFGLGPPNPKDEPHQVFSSFFFSYGFLPQHFKAEGNEHA